MEKFCEYLEEQRKLIGLTKAQLARKIGWTPMYYGRFENGDIYPTEANISKFAVALKVEENELRRFIKK